MPIELLSPGPVFTLVQNQVYATPARACALFSNRDLDISNQSNFATSASIASNATVNVAAAFIRCTATGAQVIFKVF
jgi:hypothetical protein